MDLILNLCIFNVYLSLFALYKMVETSIFKYIILLMFIFHSYYVIKNFTVYGIDLAYYLDLGFQILKGLL